MKNEYFVSSAFKDSLFAVNQSLMFPRLLFTTVKMFLMSVKDFLRGQSSGSIFLGNNFPRSFLPRDTFPDIHRSASELNVSVFCYSQFYLHLNLNFSLDVFRKLTFMSVYFSIVDIILHRYFHVVSTLIMIIKLSRWQWHQHQYRHLNINIAFDTVQIVFGLKLNLHTFITMTLLILFYYFEKRNCKDLSEINI